MWADLGLSLAGRRAGRPRRGSRAPSAGEPRVDDAGMGSGSEASTEPLSTGSEFLDKALVLHLHSCNCLLLVSMAGHHCHGHLGPSARRRLRGGLFALLSSPKGGCREMGSGSAP